MSQFVNVLNHAFRVPEEETIYRNLSSLFTPEVLTQLEKENDTKLTVLVLRERTYAGDVESMTLVKFFSLIGPAHSGVSYNLLGFRCLLSLEGETTASFTAFHDLLTTVASDQPAVHFVLSTTGFLAKPYNVYFQQATSGIFEEDLFTGYETRVVSF